MEMENFEYGLQDEEEMTVTLTLDDDSELECAVVAIFPVQDKDYIALLPPWRRGCPGVLIPLQAQHR